MKFEEILTIATIVAGLIVLLDKLLWRKKRAMLSADSQLSAKEPVLIEYARSFFPVLLLVLVLRSFLAEPFRIPSESMKPTLLVGDFILVNKYDYGIRLPMLRTKILNIGEPKRGDIIVFRHVSGKDLIKRVVGLPGDKITYRHNILAINGEPLQYENETSIVDVDQMGMVHKILHKKEKLIGKDHHVYIPLGERAKRKYPNEDVEVPAGQYFVMGDNRGNSEDSRVWGFVKENDIIGRAFATWMSWDSNKPGIRWRRVGNYLD